MSEKKRILVVDDEPDFAGIVQQNLEKEGFEVEVAYDGDEGLEKVKANPPDAIVLDVMMPGKDGYQVCSELKADEQYADIPVILLTAVTMAVQTMTLGPRSNRFSTSSLAICMGSLFVLSPASARICCTCFGQKPSRSSCLRI